MSLRNRLSPSVLLRLGMLFLILFSITDRPLHLQALLGENWADGTRGMLMGLSVGFNLLSIAKRRQMSC